MRPDRIITAKRILTTSISWSFTNHINHQTVKVQIKSPSREEIADGEKTDRATAGDKRAPVRMELKPRYEPTTLTDVLVSVNEKG
ncbi:hypothetical protein Clacol_007034 [Clathrus columnatus]|uniref:Uncharacterized protein n=1 Tax=Clathrus columnatus TaxID=1419009 RepID=A0AAV5AJE7_9AGAM|nr:hypothetical protein Clacol_007034 [Clathrus columnatus]